MEMIVKGWKAFSLELCFMVLNPQCYFNETSGSTARGRMSQALSPLVEHVDDVLCAGRRWWLGVIV